MRLATFNVLHGVSLDDGEVGGTRLAEACASLEADVLVLQEVDRNQPRSGRADQASEIAGAMDVGADGWRFAPALVGEPGGAWRACGEGDEEAAGDEASFGVALVSRLPVREWHTVCLTGAPVGAPVYLPRSRPPVVWVRDEPRVALVAELDSPAGPLTVATTHLSFVPGWNAWQLRRLCRLLAERAPAGGPCILLGDLNLPAALPRWFSGWRTLAEAKTFPAPNPALQIDHALGRGRLPAVTGAEARLLPVSDHRALVVNFADS